MPDNMPQLLQWTVIVTQNCVQHDRWSSIHVYLYLPQTYTQLLNDHLAGRHGLTSFPHHECHFHQTTVPVGLLRSNHHCWHRRHLRSTNHQLLAVPRYLLNTYGCWAFSVAGPTVWNSLPDFIWDPTISGDCFRRLLKTYLFARY